MTARGLSLVLLSAAVTVVANLLLRVGIRGTGAAFGAGGGFPRALLRLLGHPAFDAGVVLYGFAALLWIRIVATEPLSAAYPLLITITFVLVTVGAVALFGESLTLRKVTGLAIMVIGILVVGSE
jgi:multidrug transporter EmrE-like cation transporter